MSACTHIGCSAVGDGECHLDAEGWMVNITREQHLRVRDRIGCPTDEMAQAIIDLSDYGRDMVVRMFEILGRHDLSKADRKHAEKIIERLRQCGVPREPWKEH